ASSSDGQRRGCLTSRCQLSARRQNVAPPRTSDEGVNPTGFENLAKRFNTLCRRRMIRQRFGGIVRNQIYLCPQRMTVEQVRKLSRMLIRIIHTVEHHVFEGESFSRLE